MKKNIFVLPLFMFNIHILFYYQIDNKIFSLFYFIKKLFDYENLHQICTCR